MGERLGDWIEILEGTEPDTPVTLCPTEVVHLLFDLRLIQEMLARESADTAPDLIRA